MPGSLLPRLGGVAAIVGGALNLARYTRDRAFSFGRTTTRPRRRWIPPAPCPTRVPHRNRPGRDGHHRSVTEHRHVVSLSPVASCAAQ